MGANAVVRVGGKFEEVELAQAEFMLMTRGIVGVPGERNLTVVGDEESRVEPCVEWNTVQRYYGVGYERGDWPVIHAAIVALSEFWPERPVYYGSDEGGVTPVTPGLLAAGWSHWLSGQGGDYAHGAIRWNATHNPSRVCADLHPTFGRCDQLAGHKGLHVSARWRAAW